MASAAEEGAAVAATEASDGDTATPEQLPPNPPMRPLATCWTRVEIMGTRGTVFRVTKRNEICIAYDDNTWEFWQRAKFDEVASPVDTSCDDAFNAISNVLMRMTGEGTQAPCAFLKQRGAEISGGPDDSFSWDLYFRYIPAPAGSGYSPPPICFQLECGAQVQLLNGGLVPLSDDPGRPSRTKLSPSLPLGSFTFFGFVIGTEMINVATREKKCFILVQSQIGENFMSAVNASCSIGSVASGSAELVTEPMETAKTSVVHAFTHFVSQRSPSDVAGLMTTGQTTRPTTRPTTRQNGQPPSSQPPSSAKLVKQIPVALGGKVPRFPRDQSGDGESEDDSEDEAVSVESSKQDEVHWVDLLDVQMKRVSEATMLKLTAATARRYAMRMIAADQSKALFFEGLETAAHMDIAAMCFIANDKNLPKAFQNFGLSAQALQTTNRQAAKAAIDRAKEERAHAQATERAKKAAEKAAGKAIRDAEKVAAKATRDAEKAADKTARDAAAAKAAEKQEKQRAQQRAQAANQQLETATAAAKADIVNTARTAMKAAEDAQRAAVDSLADAQQAATAAVSKAATAAAMVPGVIATPGANAVRAIATPPSMLEMMREIAYLRGAERQEPTRAGAGRLSELEFKLERRKRKRGDHY